MDRILKGHSATITVAFTVDGTPTDPAGNTVTVGISRDDGTTVVAAGTATTRVSAGVYSYTLSPTHTADLDVLTASWTASFSGFAQTTITTVEIVGGFLFSIAQARTLKPLDDSSRYSTAAIVAARTAAEIALENECKVAFVPRYHRETLSGDDTTTVRARKRLVRTVRSAAVDDVALTSDELADVKVTAGRTLYRTDSNVWDDGVENIEVAYEHGMDEPPGRVGRAALLLAKRALVDSPVNDRATSITNADQGVTQWLVTAGVRGAIFDIPECNAVVDRYGYTDAGLHSD